MPDIRSSPRLSSRKITPWQQFLTQLLLAVVAVFVIAPIWGLLRVSLDASIRSVPTSFSLFPVQPSLAVFEQVWHTPSQALTFLGLLRNSLLVSGASALMAVVMGASMAYAFARFRFRGREPGLLAILVGAFLPLVALMTPLYILLEALGLRSSLVGLIVVYTAFSLPFCIWNMRAAFQSIPVEMEEAALLDGATPWGTFTRVSLPNALPAIGVAALLAFLTAYSEFAIGWLFVENSQNVTLAMALWGIRSMGSYPWSQLAAMAVLMSLPVVIIFIVLQRALFDRMVFGMSRE